MTQHTPWLLAFLSLRSVAAKVTAPNDPDPEGFRPEFCSGVWAGEALKRAPMQVRGPEWCPSLGVVVPGSTCGSWSTGGATEHGSASGGPGGGESAGGCT